VAKLSAGQLDASAARGSSITVRLHLGEVESFRVAEGKVRDVGWMAAVQPP